MTGNENHSDQQLSILSVPQRFGVYPWWPAEDDSWIHPDDVELCYRLIPSPRVFRREFLDQQYNRLTYGELILRVRPTMWLEVPTDGYLVGDRVEIRSEMGRRRPAIARIEDIFFCRRQQRLEYYLSVQSNRISEPFELTQFQPAFDLNEPMNARQRELMERARLM